MTTEMLYTEWLEQEEKLAELRKQIAALKAQAEAVAVEHGRLANKYFRATGESVKARFARED